MTKIPVIDSHIHLYSETNVDNIAWLKSSDKLYGNQRLEEYDVQVIPEPFESKGVIFIETDVKSGLSEKDWDLPIEEYLFVERLVNGHQKPGEGSIKGSGFIKAIIPWAPLPAGAIELEKYVNKLKSATEVKENVNLVKGFRYLIQDKPDGTSIQKPFIEGLNWLGENNYIFDLGIDVHSRGIVQLEEFEQVDSHTKNVTYIVNHLIKPDFEDDILLQKVREIWTRIAKSSKNKYYTKLSGVLTELPFEISIDDAVRKITPWLLVFVDLFGKDSIIWGSNWPVATLDLNDPLQTWEKWVTVTRKLQEIVGLDDDIYYKNIVKAYSLDE